MNNRSIKNLGGPTDNSDAANKSYVDKQNAKQDIAINSKLDKTGGLLSGNLDMNGNRIFRLPNPTDIQQPVTVVYCDSRYLRLSGGNQMSGDLDMGGNNILSVENLTDYKDTDPYDYRVKDVKSVVNKEYLNEKFMKKVDKDGREYFDLKGRIIRNC